MIDQSLDRLLTTTLVDKDGDVVRPVLLPGLSDAEIAEAERAQERPYPDELRAILRRTGGVDGLLASIDFAGRGEGQTLDELFPAAATVAEDGYGNAWVVDLLCENGSWGPIWFLSHDPPVALYQCDGLATFLDELVRMFTPPHASLIDDVHDDRLLAVGRTHRGSMQSEHAAVAADPALAAFGAELGPGWTVVDCREAQPGMGIAWGRFGPRTELRRHGDLQLFACRRPEKRGLLSRLRGAR